MKGLGNMTQGQALKAYFAVNELNKQTFSGQTAKKIFNLFEKLKPAYNFSAQEEKKIFERYPQFDPTINGCPIKDPNNKNEIEAAKRVAKEVDKALTELNELPFEIEFEPFTISAEEQTNLKISGQFIGYLQGLIEFE